MMKNSIPAFFFAALLLAISSTSMSCVGKKRFLHEVSTRDSMVTQLNKRVIELNQEIANLKLQLAEKNGENKALRELQDKQDQQIDRLKLEIEKLTDQSLSQQQIMDATLKRKEQEIAKREEILTNMRTTMEDQEKALAELMGQLQSSLADYDPTNFSTDFRDGKAVFSVPEELLFRPGSTSSAKQAMDVLEKIAGVLSNHPEVDITVKGHTDNQPVKSKSFADNWDFSAQRAAAVVKILTKEFYLNPSQITAAAKGEFEPSTSNETAEGRGKNRRMEFVLTPKIDKVVRLIREYKKAENRR